MVIYKIRLNYVVLERSLANINCASLLNAVIGDRRNSDRSFARGISNISSIETPAGYRFPLLLGGENPTGNLPNVTKLFGVV
ncbi:hypothetical protein CEP10_06730 [Cylindrospermopsis raciborskii S07]|nr:hypothetical protein [Cylindrospermopsis raciborskii]PNK03462.1 hypothetical protein CEP11_13400 [Cylindrospermopsis raciborskii S10]PNK04824.1 hypothetical protein CEP12_12315 [Cylindrospermopsis raciborskii S14]PNK08847.1 hypothetical protein CEP10_06730 [Cylindrospermopsis raciborskii S07]PNK16436.1 hypothetical protein CEP09_06910 [Cylindrospermopsis raciborskii S06]PNK19795.1 hypothetical protein CEP08_04475 [Cylindrospermopsis raciborskii S05]